MKKFIVSILCLFIFIIPFAFASHPVSVITNPDVVAGFRMEENSADSSVNYNDASEQGGLFYISSKGGFGTGEHALHLDGTPDYLNATDISDYTLTEFSVTLWIAGNTPASDSVVVGQWDRGGNERSWRIYYDGTDGNFSVEISDDGTAGAGDTIEYRTSLGGLSGSDWNHIGFTYSLTGNDINLYVNGVKDPSPTAVVSNPIVTIYDSDEDLTIGCSYNDPSNPELFFDGFIDEVLIFNRTLTPAEINNVYVNGVDDEETTGTPTQPRTYINYSRLIIDENFDYTSPYSSNGWSFFSNSDIPSKPVPSTFDTLIGGFGNNGTGADSENVDGAFIYRSFNTEAIESHESLVFVFDVEFSKSNRPSPPFTIRLGNETSVFAGTTPIRVEVFDTQSSADRIQVDFSNAPFTNATTSSCDISDFVTKTGTSDLDNVTFNGEVALMIDFGRLQYWVYVNQIPLTDCQGVSMGTLDNPNYEINTVSITTSLHDRDPEVGYNTDTILDNFQLGEGYFGLVMASGIKPVDDLTVAVSSIWDDMGLKSKQSKYLLGLGLMIIMAMFMWGASVSNQLHLSPIVLVIAEFFFMIFLTYVGLLPKWLPYVVGLLAIAGVILAIKSMGSNGGV